MSDFNGTEMPLLEQMNITQDKINNAIALCDKVINELTANIDRINIELYGSKYLSA